MGKSFKEGYRPDKDYRRKEKIFKKKSFNKLKGVKPDAFNRKSC